MVHETFTSGTLKVFKTKREKFFSFLAIFVTLLSFRSSVREQFDVVVSNTDTFSQSVSSHKNVSQLKAPATSSPKVRPKEIEILLPQEQIEWMKNRTNHFDSWFTYTKGGRRNLLLEPADKNGPILDFIVAGFPKCGTTTLMANLGYLAPMPKDADVCTPPAQTVYYSYFNWPAQFGDCKRSKFCPRVTNDTVQKIFRGTKCPMFISEEWIGHYSRTLPKTKLIVGIRHPIKWFLSFWNMQDDLRPYDLTEMCPCPVNEKGWRQGAKCTKCRLECPRRQLFCLARARFHLPLARLGKTPLGSMERKLLAPNDVDGGDSIISMNVTNQIFLYDQTELKEDYFWDSLAYFLGVSHIPNFIFQSSAGAGKNYTLCDPYFDAFRAMMMPYSYELSVWLRQYFLPVAKDTNRSDVRVADLDRLYNIVEDYVHDPCNRLIRMHDGTYVLNSTFGTMLPAPTKTT